MREGWEHFPHEADIGVRGFGGSLEQAFEQAALALTAVTLDPARIEPREEVSIQCTAPDEELLLADWLNALIYESSLRKMAFSRFRVTIEGVRLQAAAVGDRIDPEVHRPAVEVKGATYTCLKVERNNRGGWTAQCVVDV